MMQPSKYESCWFAVRTRYRCEKAVFRLLEDQGIHAYLPLIRHKRQHGVTQRQRLVMLPLISGYIFVKITQADYLKVLQTDNVINFVRLGRELVHIPEEEIDILKQCCQAENLKISLNQYAYCVGDKVRIIAGPLRGITGKLQSIQSGDSLVIELKNVGYSLRVVHIKPEQVERINELSH